jgi:nucleotide-binding universal stress UspA family protein
LKQEIVIMYRNILLPLDASPFAEHALPMALSLARRANAKIHLTLVHTPLAPTYGELPANIETALNSRHLQMEEAYLEGIVGQLRKASPTVPISSFLPEGPVAETIQEQAIRLGADLIMMTTHGRSEVGRMWLGSVVDELLRFSTVPLLLNKPQEATANLVANVAFRHVLIPLDGSTVSEQIIGPALELGKLMDADCTLLRAVEPLPQIVQSRTLPPTPAIPDDMNRFQAEQIRVAREYLEGVAQRVRSQAPRLQTAVTGGERAAKAILNEIGPRGIDLVALVMHSGRRVARRVLGSVSDKVLRAANVPILLYRPHPT